MGLIPYNSNSALSLTGVTLTIAKASATGLPAAGTAVTGTDSGDLFTTTAAHNMKTGDKLTLTVSSGLTGFTTGTYYVIYMSSTTFKLAASLALAAAGTHTAMSADGTGTIAYAGQTYIAQNWSPKVTTREVERRDASGDVSDFSIRPEPTRQSGLTLQLASQYSAVPRVGMEFADPDDSTITYVVTAASRMKNAGEFFYCEIDYRDVTATYAG